MKVLVLNEPFVKGFCRTQRWATRTRARVLRAPEWLAYATSVLKKYGHEALLFDFPARDWGKEELRKLVAKEQPDFVVLDSTTPSIKSDIDCGRICKEVSKAKVIMVGPHASALPEETLKQSGERVDVIAIGEYDNTVKDIVENFNDLEKIPGIVFWKENKPFRTVPRPLIENLDELPFPAWDQLDIMKYYSGIRRYPYLTLIAGRGCPYRCTFCLWPQTMHGRKFRLRSAKNVVDEMEYTLKLFPQLRKGEFFFEDDTFTAVPKHAVDICEEILKRNLKITFTVNARADIKDPKILRLLKRAGCRLFWVGYESGNPEILENIRKGVTPEEMETFTRLVHEAGIKIHGCFALGMPGETKKSIEETIRFALGLNLDSLQFSAAVPFPGTEYFNYCEEQKLLKDYCWDQWTEQGEQSGVIEYPGLTLKYLNKSVDRALTRFYYRPGQIFKMLTGTKNLYDFYRTVRGAYNYSTYLMKKYTG
ncbi:MAG TPA: radical SAM protein [bacterium]|nr:radical SAM protein [bacterium]